jgi:hypothetical protein
MGPRVFLLHEQAQADVVLRRQQHLRLASAPVLQRVCLLSTMHIFPDELHPGMGALIDNFNRYCYY